VSSTHKGVEDLYEFCCDGNFYDWVFPNKVGEAPLPIAPRYICMAPIYYKNTEVLTLLEDNYDPIHEDKSTWKIGRFKDGVREDRLPHRPYKIFQLETDDDLLVMKCKVRPALVINKIETDWRIPVRYTDGMWLCLPLFTYKNRHSQQYVFSDQRLQIPHRFYFPPGSSGGPGLDEECAGLINELQCIPDMNLSAKRCFCNVGTPQMSRPIQLSEKAFHAVVGHIANFLPEISITGKALEWYEFFRELVNEEISKVLSS
jgi:hypothetical protein